MAGNFEGLIRTPMDTSFSLKSVPSSRNGDFLQLRWQDQGNLRPLSFSTKHLNVINISLIKCVLFGISAG